MSDIDARTALEKQEQSENYDEEAASSVTGTPVTRQESDSDVYTDEKGQNGVDRSKSNVSVAETLSPLREALFVTVVCLAQLLTQAGLGQVLSILHVIADDFGITNPGVLAWLIAGYSLTVGTFILVSGRLGDLYGYKLMLLLGFAWMGIWELVCGLAVYSNSVLFIFARVLSGIGPSMMLPNGLAILGATYNPGKKKNLAFALFGGVAPGGSILGAAGAGVFALAWWPWAFWCFALVLFGVVAVGYCVIPSDPRPPQEKMSFMQAVEAVDLLGAVVGVTALILINFAWNQAGVVGWSYSYVYVLLIVGVLLVPAFFWIEFKVAKTPLLPFDALNKDVAFVLGCVACGWGCFGIWIYYSWQFFELLRDATPLQATAWVSPVAIVGAVASLTTAWLLGRLRAPWVMTIALTAFTVGTILIATAPVDQIYWSQTFVMTLIIPFGMDMSFPAASLILSDAVPKDRQGVAMSLVNTTVNYSIAIALGIAGTVESHVTGGDTSRSAMLKGFRASWYFAIGLSVSGLCLSLVFLLRSYIRSKSSPKT